MLFSALVLAASLASSDVLVLFIALVLATSLAAVLAAMLSAID